MNHRERSTGMSAAAKELRSPDRFILGYREAVINDLRIDGRVMGAIRHIKTTWGACGEICSKSGIAYSPWSAEVAWEPCGVPATKCSTGTWRSKRCPCPDN
jgi:hypothetical protein